MKRWIRGLWSLVDSGEPGDATASAAVWPRVVSLAVLHLGCLLVIWVGWSPVAAASAVGLYLLRAFFVTGFYHRYFSHRTYKTSRVAQFVFAVLGCSAVQRGPLWWAAHHRQHHRSADDEGDPHSPHRDGFLKSHLGWLVDPRNFPTKVHLVRDLARYPELRFLDRFDIVVSLTYGALLLGAGAALNALWPSLGTSGPQMFVWGFFVSTALLFHATSLVNSAAHTLGRRRYRTEDQSRNSWIVTLLTMGEGWHNNHHYYPGTVRQGFYWWELDPTYYLLRVLEKLGIIWDLQPVPQRILEEGRRGTSAGQEAA